MTQNRLAHIEDLTRRYAKYRPCGGGLGTLCGAILLQFFIGLVLGWILRQVETGTQSQSFWQFLAEAHLVTPISLKVAAIATPFLAWLGILLSQWWVDRRFGAVEGLPSFEAKLVLQRVLCPLFILIYAVFAFFQTRFLFLNPTYALPGWILVGILAIGVLALVWAYSSRDGQTLTVMFFVSAPSLFILHSAYADLQFLLALFTLYSLLGLRLVLMGGLRFAGFLKVSRELAAIQPESE